VALAKSNSERADDIFIVLAFSGGGTRSAAFSYGVLEALRDTTVSLHGRSRRLLDEVDVITSVSGGSYTAAYYGLFGDRLFTEFEGRFLKRDVEGALTSLLVNPLVLASLAMPESNRSDVAAAWLGDQVFENKTYADMQSRPGPSVIINASDINTGTTFSFIQQQFDFLCSSLDGFPVARAVMASSAVPGYFAPIAVRNFGGDCPRRRNNWVARRLEHPDLYDRDYHVARALDRYTHPETLPVVRLVDGGMTDNLGVRGSMMSPVLHDGNVADMRGAFDEGALDKISKVLVIVANAQIYEDYGWSRTGRDPGLIGTLSASFDSAIGILNSETIALARHGFAQWAERTSRRPARSGRPVELAFSVLTFDQIRDEKERRYFNTIPMALTLPATQVDELRTLAGRLLYGSPEFRRFVGSLK
jgi:NTE family protein